MHDLLKETAHRAWPVPTGEWVMEQTWRDLLFAHWSYPVEALRAVVPAELPLDMYEGRAWVGVVPFQLDDLKMRGLPVIPGLSSLSFPELNVRTYVTVGRKPGVYFFSLDAGSRIAVHGARTLFHLNYYEADMRATRTPSGIDYASKRTDARGAAAHFRAQYSAAGEAMTPAAGSLEHFLTERYCLYTVRDSGAVHRLEIHHRPWLLQPATAELDAGAMLMAAGLTIPAAAPLLHFSAIQPMIGWLPERV